MWTMRKVTESSPETLQTQQEGDTLGGMQQNSNT